MLLEAAQTVLDAVLKRSGCSSQATVIVVWVPEPRATGEPIVIPNADGLDAERLGTLFNDVRIAFTGFVGSASARRNSSSRRTGDISGIRQEVLDIVEGMRRPLSEAFAESDRQFGLTTVLTSAISRDSGYCWAGVRVATDVLADDPSMLGFAASATMGHTSSSLVDALIWGVLDDLSRGLGEADTLRFVAAISTLRTRPVDDRLREAAKRLLNTVAVVGILGAGLETRAPENLWYVFNALSALDYEERAPSGTIFVTRIGHPNIEVLTTLHNPIQLSSQPRHLRAVRKMLEMATHGYALLTNALYVTGIGRLTVPNRADIEELLLEVSFKSRFVWELAATGPLMRVGFGEATLPLATLAPEEALARLKDVFPSMEDNAASSCADLFASAASVSHGALLVVSDGAEAEANRLAAVAAATRVSAFVVKPEHIATLAAIDGALLVGTDGMCYAVGAILDGNVDVANERSRGARFNSALRYVTAQSQAGNRTIACVVSSDHTVDLLPSGRDGIAEEAVAMADSYSEAKDRKEPREAARMDRTPRKVPRGF